MRFTLLGLAGLAAVATALPQRQFNGRPDDRPNGLSNGQSNAVPIDLPYGALDAQAPTAPNNQPAVVPENQPTDVPADNGVANGAGDNNGNGAGNNTNGAFDAALVPEFGVEAGQNPDGTGNCSGNKGKIIPCVCPPDRDDFIQKVSAAVAAGNSEGVPVEFPTDKSSASEKTRIQTAIVVLQNLNGKGRGCPAAATTFLEQQAAA